MNKRYSLKVDGRNKLVVVSELCARIKKRSGRALMPVKKMALVAGVLCSMPLHAADVGNILPYQTYRDFAQNKGGFQPGQENITLYNKNGEVAGVLDQAPMIDFSSVDTLGIATLVNPQYVVSVKHNVGYQGVRFGYRDDSYYSIVGRNEDWQVDFHAPRLNKIVTEVDPAEMIHAGTANNIYADKTRFPVFYRVGSGTQYVRMPNGQLHSINDAYSYLIGGTVGSVSSYQKGQMITTAAGQLYNVSNGPMASYGEPGDSGSPLFAWDTTINKWTIIGVLKSNSGVGGAKNNWTVIPVNYVNNVMALYTDPAINNADVTDPITWRFDTQTGSGSLEQGNNHWVMHGSINGKNINNGKDLAFTGDGGKIVLANSVDQGAGALTFDGDYTVAPATNETWKGGGITVNDNHTVDWQVNGVKGDSLHKLGKGTLLINGTGINPGSLSVGDGTVVLAQRPDANGQLQAFQSVSIVSGRPTLVLSNSAQINPDNITWGYRGGKLDINGNDLTFHQLNGADNGAVLTNSGATANVNLDFNKSDPTAAVTTLWHGQFTGNVNVNNSAGSGTKNTFVIDGGMHTTGSMTQQNGALYLQGHPVVHAVSTQAVADKLKALGDDSVLTQPVSFTQNDWETRQFTMRELNLINADFHLARNASLSTTINAQHASVTLGSKDLYIDTNDGNGVTTSPVAGESSATSAADQSQFDGMVRLDNDSTLNINERFNGGIVSNQSSTTVTSANALLTQYSQFTQSALSIADNAGLTGYAGLSSDGDVHIGRNAFMSMMSVAGSYMPYSAKNWMLDGRGATLEMGENTVTTGNIVATDTASVRIGSGNGTASYRGNMFAPQADVAMNSAQWQMEGASSVNSLTLNDAQLNSHTDGVSADTVAISGSLNGQNNQLYVTPTRRITALPSSGIVLVTAPKGTDTQVLKAGTQSVGFHSLTPQLEVTNTDDATQWLLKGFNKQGNKSVLRDARSFMDIGYNNFLVEMNNLNDRMGDLRKIQGDPGVWARIMNGSGSADAGYKDNYTHLQVGFDKKHRLEGVDVFTGATMTFTNNEVSADAYRGRTKSVGTGVYASAVFDSGMYLDAIGKYVRHDNHYDVKTLGLGNEDYRSHSWYLGVEAGWRYQLTADVFVEPQTELVYGTLSGNQFAWKYNDMDVSMARKQGNPLVGRTGVEFGKTFSGKDWSITTQAGVAYQYDLRNTGDTVFHDLSGGTYEQNGKDSRMLMNIGLNGEIKENTRIGLNLERSAFGRYNIDNAINANIRYTF